MHVRVDPLEGVPGRTLVQKRGRARTREDDQHVRERLHMSRVDPRDSPEVAFIHLIQLVLIFQFDSRFRVQFPVIVFRRE